MFTLTIIGGGAIACGYDSPDDTKILTHIHAAILHPDVKLSSIVENNISQQKKIEEKWGTNFTQFSNINNAINFDKSDIIIIATPTITHLDIIKEVLSIYEPKLIICEKPIVSNIFELEELQNIEMDVSTKLITNFTRRYDPSLNRLKDFIENDIKKIHHFYGTFTKGLLHNGSHMIDLIYMLIGKVNTFGYINKDIINNDVFGQFIINTDNAIGIISNINNDKLALFEFTIYADNAKIEIIGENQDIFINHIENSAIHTMYQSYSAQEKLIKSLDKSGYNTLNYGISMILDDAKYNSLKHEQDSVNRFIYSIYKHLMET